MTSMNLRKLLTLVFAVYLTACGGGGESVSGSDNPGVAPGGAPGVASGGGSGGCTSACTATLIWIGVADSRIDGYRVYFGTTTPLNVVNAAGFFDVPGAATTNAAISAASLGLPAGTTAHLAVSAINSTTGVESPISAEVSAVL
jgi:hypothetical protein